MSDIGQIIDWPQVATTTASPASVGNEMAALNNAFNTAQNWASSNTAVYIPFRIAFTTNFSSMFWMNGTAGTDSCDVGVYTFSGSKIVSTGGTLTSGALQPQIVSVTPTTLSPGLYYFAMARNGTTNTLYAVASIAGQVTRGFGIYVASTSYPLSSTVIFAGNTGQSPNIPFMGFTKQGVV